MTLTELRLALAAFERLPEEPDDAAAELRQLVWVDRPVSLVASD